MEIKLNDEKDERQNKIEEIMKPQMIYMKDSSGKKVEFEVVSVVTMEKRIFTIVKNPNAPVGKGKLAMFEYVKLPIKEDPGKYLLVQDKETLRKVTEEHNRRLRAMDEKGMIPKA